MQKQEKAEKGEKDQPISQQPIMIRQSKYSKQLNNYTRYQFPNIVPLLMVISKQCKYGAKYPVCKILKVIAKHFLLNQIQGIFFVYLIQQTEWNIREKIIYLNSDNVRDIISYSIDNCQYKSLILYLMVGCYTVKYYLNQDHDDFLQDTSKIIPNFKGIFESWVKKHANITSRINLKMLNRVYKELYTNLRLSAVDFNMMVDSIIQISPAYNSERDKTKEKQVKVVSKNNCEKGKLDPGKRLHSFAGNIQAEIVKQSEYHKLLPIIKQQANEHLLYMNPLSSLTLKKNDSNLGHSFPSPMLLKGESVKDDVDLFLGRRQILCENVNETDLNQQNKNPEDR